MCVATALEVSHVIKFFGALLMFLGEYFEIPAHAITETEQKTEENKWKAEKDLQDNFSQNDLTHCVFTDEGCGVSVVVVCPTEEKFEWVYESVAKSVHLFVNALKTEGTPFRKEHFELPVTVSEEVFLYVNGDDGDGYGDSEMIAASTDTLIDNDTLPSGTIDSGDGVAVTTDDNISLLVVIACAFIHSTHI